MDKVPHSWSYAVAHLAEACSKFLSVYQLHWLLAPKFKSFAHTAALEWMNEWKYLSINKTLLKYKTLTSQSILDNVNHWNILHFSL